MAVTRHLGSPELVKAHARQATTPGSTGEAVTPAHVTAAPTVRPDATVPVITELALHGGRCRAVPDRRNLLRHEGIGSRWGRRHSSWRGSWRIPDLACFTRWP